MRKYFAGRYINQGLYKSFQPEHLCREWQIDDMSVISLLSKADRHLGRLDMYSQYVNIDLYISMHIAKEATDSTKIEGTQTNMEDAFLNMEDIPIAKRDDWEEVQNYIEAMNTAISLLKRLPFSSRLIKEVHKVLLKGVRGQHKLPGEYRKSQNWIGGSSINDAVFVPPIHDSIGDLMSDIEKFANDDQYSLPDLLKIAIIHYQFETVHPFLDGNGRVGRLLIPLYLVEKKILKQPILYLSSFFERNRTLYYDNLMRARTQNDINQWLKFFLEGVIQTSIQGVETFDGILQLKKDVEHRISTLKGRMQDANKVVDYLYSRPLITAPVVQHLIGKSNVTAYDLIARLEEIGLLRNVSETQRNRVYAFKEYIDLF